MFMLAFSSVGWHFCPQMTDFVPASHPQSFNSTYSRIFKDAEMMISLSTTLPHFRLAFQKSGPPQVVRNMFLNNFRLTNIPGQTFPGTRFDFCAFPIEPPLCSRFCATCRGFQIGNWLIGRTGHKEHQSPKF